MFFSVQLKRFTKLKSTTAELRLFHVTDRCDLNKAQIKS